ncbi:MAG: extracellular solute-binding protein [Chloroflexi bacterium]|nr:extracellular solute-binding protein [Chloroflexota bacterium]
MNKLGIFVMAGVLALGLISDACGPQSPPPGGITPAPAARTQPPGAPAPSGQSWDSIVADAKKEGVVSIYTFWGPDTRTAVMDAFKKKYGIDVEFTAFSRGEEILVRVQSETRAGLYLADVFGVGGATLVNTMKPAGILAPIEPVLVLPEAKDPRAWTGGQLPFQENDRLGVGMSAYLNRPVGINTDLVKRGEITSYLDVLKPQYKGKITLQDPTVTGAGNTIFVSLALDVWDQDRALDYLRQLVRQQEVVIQRDLRLHNESMARGKFAIALGPQSTTLADFLRAGAPVDMAVMKEGTFVSVGAGAIGVPLRYAHPNAAKVFVNWLLTKEGQTAYSRGYGIPSLRTDVSTEGINALFLPRPEEKMHLDSEKHYEMRGKMTELTREVLKETAK